MIRSLSLVLPILLTTTQLSIAELSVDDLQFHGMSIRVAATKQDLNIEPLSRQSASAEGAISLVTPTWRNGFRLPKVAWTYGALTPGSVRIRTMATPSVPLTERRDFVVNGDWATIGALEPSQVAAGTRVHVAFAYTASRIDLIEASADGTLAIKRGTPHMNAPLVPQPSPGAKPVFGIYLPHNTTALSAKNVNRISTIGAIIPPVKDTGSVRQIMAQIETGAPTTICFLGDSITAQTDVAGGSFVDRFSDYLKRRYPTHRISVVSPSQAGKPARNDIVVVKAGIGGDNSSQGLARFESDVARHQPSLVVVMFGANDENKRQNGEPAVSVAQYRKNLIEIIQRTRQAGGEAIILSPAMKNLGWVATSGLMDRFADAAGQAAADQAACFVDVHDAWKRIPSTGSNYMVYLNSSINHPNHFGHELFFEGLRNAVEANQ